MKSTTGAEDTALVMAAWVVVERKAEWGVWRLGRVRREVLGRKEEGRVERRRDCVVLGECLKGREGRERSWCSLETQ